MINLKANKRELKGDITTKRGKSSAATRRSRTKRKSKKAYLKKTGKRKREGGIESKSSRKMKTRCGREKRDRERVLRRI